MGMREFSQLLPYYSQKPLASDVPSINSEMCSMPSLNGNVQMFQQSYPGSGIKRQRKKLLPNLTYSKRNTVNVIRKLYEVCVKMKSTFSRSMTFHRSCAGIFEAQMPLKAFLVMSDNVPIRSIHSRQKQAVSQSSGLSCKTSICRKFRSLTV